MYSETKSPEDCKTKAEHIRRKCLAEENNIRNRWPYKEDPREENDPHGIQPNAPGAKLDAGKIRADLVLDGFGLALMEVAKVSTFGAAKYSEGGWESVADGPKRYRAAGDRHRLVRRFDQVDDQSNLPHLAHQAWNVLAELELELRKLKG